MVFLDGLKTFIGRAAGNKAGNALQTSVSGAPPPSLAQAFNEAAKMASKMFEEREWQCPCGHKFRASGEWVACAAVYCEAPSCPNPTFYLDGPGRALLEANPAGVKLQEVTDGKTSSSNAKKGPGGVGGRFR